MTSSNDERQIIRDLSDRIVTAQRPVRILNAIKWDGRIKQQFFADKCEKLPAVDAGYYESQPLPFDVDEKITEFRQIIRDSKNLLGQYSEITTLIQRQCDDYCVAMLMLKARGTPLFSQLAMELYGAPDDTFYPNGPRLCEMGGMLAEILQVLKDQLQTEADEKRYTAEQAQEILQERLSHYFTEHQGVVTVEISDDIVADASAGADTIKLNSHVMFSDRDLRYLEVHEGWVHVGTTLNGAAQPYCTFLSKGSPASSVTQEGLAVITEIFTFSSYPKRMLKITNRINALQMIQQGANFIDVFRYFKESGLSDDESYSYTHRVFRGSLPDGGPFTKDLSYTKGFVLIYNLIRLAVRYDKLNLIPMLFTGKALIEGIQILSDLTDQGIVSQPIYMPPQFKDLAALSSWMSFSLFLNQFDLDKVAEHYAQMLNL